MKLNVSERLNVNIEAQGLFFATSIKNVKYSENDSESLRNTVPNHIFPSIARVQTQSSEQEVKGCSQRLHCWWPQRLLMDL